jgi:hypothetical protein
MSGKRFGTSGTKEKRMKRRHLFLGIFLLSLSLLVGSCNSAPDGFNAPTGSTVTLPKTGSVKLAPGATLYLATPVNVALETGDPGNNIYVLGICTMCEIADWPDGTERVDPTEAVVVGTSYPFSTGSSGSRTVVIVLKSPDTYGVDSYEAKFSATLGNGEGGDMTITVSAFE